MIPKTQVLRGVLAVAALSALIGACSPREEKRSSAPLPSAPTPQERTRVLNGDVMVIDGKHVKLAGYWAPQAPPDSRCWAEALAARQINEGVRHMVQTSTSIRFEPTGGEDLFGRTYARILLNGADLGPTLYDKGWVAKTSEKFSWCDPISKREPGAPSLMVLFDMGY